MTENLEHLTGRIMRERARFLQFAEQHGKVTDMGFNFVSSVADFVYELPSGERFEVLIRADSEYGDG